jgi:hypothetical protein
MSEKRKQEPALELFQERNIMDALAKSRHSGEKRSPAALLRREETGFQLELIPQLMLGRNDTKQHFRTF